jgi:hypothetical protein
MTMAIYIKQGFGFNVGRDFTRTDQDTLLEVDSERGRFLLGHIAGNPESSLGFLRPERVYVSVRKDCTYKKEVTKLIDPICMIANMAKR